MEIKQSNPFSKATIRQSLNETDMEVYKVQIDEDMATKALYKNERNITLDDYEEYQILQFQNFNFRVLTTPFINIGLDYLKKMFGWLTDE
jgi:hypothetical protein